VRKFASDLVSRRAASRSSGTALETSSAEYGGEVQQRCHGHEATRAANVTPRKAQTRTCRRPGREAIRVLIRRRSDVVYAALRTDLAKTTESLAA
jgi:hypothetical protein